MVLYDLGNLFLCLVFVESFYGNDPLGVLELQLMSRVGPESRTLNKDDINFKPRLSVRRVAEWTGHSTLEQRVVGSKPPSENWGSNLRKVRILISKL